MKNATKYIKQIYGKINFKTLVGLNPVKIEIEKLSVDKGAHWVAYKPIWNKYSNSRIWREEGKRTGGKTWQTFYKEVGKADPYVKIYVPEIEYLQLKRKSNELIDKKIKSYKKTTKPSPPKSKKVYVKSYCVKGHYRNVKKKKS